MRFKGLGLVVLAACGGGAADSAGGDPTPGGNVGFGGAQDIGEFRGILERGEIPGPNTLDANGFFNEHFNAPPDVTCGGPLCLTPGLSVGRDFLTGAHQATLQISVNTTVNPLEHPRLPMKLSVVVDHSGSMAEDNRLEKVKVGLHALIDQLSDEDRLSIISFDDTVTLDQPFTSTLDRERLHFVVDNLRPDGGTNIFDGLKAGLDQLGETVENEKQNRVILLSDGLATAGNTSQEAIIEMATGYVSKGIGLTTIGVGDSFDVELMRGLAERGAGNFYFVEDASAATEVFTEEVDVFMSPIALDLQITAATSTGWQMGGVVGTKQWRAGAASGDMTVPAVFFASRTSQTGEIGRRGGGSMIFINLDPSAAAAGTVADLKLSYRLPNTNEIITHTVTLDYDRPPTEAVEEPFLSYAEMAERFAMYNTFLGFRLATQMAAEGDYNCAMSVLSTTRSSAQSWNASHENDPDIAADLELADLFIANLRAHGADSEFALSSCPAAENPVSGEGEWNPDTGYNHPMACSSGRGNASWLLILGALLVIRRRRR
ncbi:MAG: VWA domain-containing protein [Deltaproteobacteria bacterium]|nr:VWA domain-containing protein [Deltaproteobacteria bacterium]